MTNTALLSEITWPVTILLAWLAGEYGHQLARLPRIGTYAVVGFVMAPLQAGFLPQFQSVAVMLVANIAFCLILFECGYRINLRWLRSNPWIAVTSVSEAALSFAAVYFLLLWFDQPRNSALLLAALSMATSPATLVRVINECRSSGQVTERLLHLATLNTVLAVFVFKIILGWTVLQTSGNLWAAAYSSLVVLGISVLLGLIAGVLTPALLELGRPAHTDSTLAFALAVICLVALTFGLQLSPVLATLTFGLCARHRRVVLNASQRGFGTLGDLVTVMLFVFIASRLEWRQVTAGVVVGLAFIGVRLLAKSLCISLFAHASGIGWRKGLWIGLATVPTPAFVILVLEQTRLQGASLVDQLVPLAAATLVLEIAGPIWVQRTLIWAHEVPQS